MDEMGAGKALFPFQIAGEAKFCGERGGKLSLLWRDGHHQNSAAVPQITELIRAGDILHGEFSEFLPSLHVALFHFESRPLSLM